MILKIIYFISLCISLWGFFDYLKRLKKLLINNSPFYSVKEYPELKILEDNFEIIKTEIPKFSELEIIDRNSSLKDAKSCWYRGKRDGAEWFNFILMHDGKVIDRAEELCPKTIKILKRIKNKGLVGFSLLLPNSKLHKHKDKVGKKYNNMPCNLLLTKHEKDNYLLVDKNNKRSKGYTDRYKHKYGKMVIFDSTFYHTAINKDSKNRIILYMILNV